MLYVLKMNRSAFESMVAEVRSTGVGVLEAEYFAQHFGSWHVSVEADPRRRLVWDGKEEWYVGEVGRRSDLQETDSWEDVWIDRAPKSSTAARAWLCGGEVPNDKRV
jgi:hypothetical protein